MPDDEEDWLWYPSVDDVLLIHQDVVDEDPQATSGVRDRDRIEFALSYVRDGHFGVVPETIHEKAFHLMRLLASNHWFVDGNKRTALNVTELFYVVNGYELDYGEDLRSMLKLFSVRESLIDRTAGPEYLSDRANRVDPDDTNLEEILASLLVRATLESADANVAESVVDVSSLPSSRSEFGLTTEYDGTVNNDDEESSSTDGG